ncbi:MAG: hypothetical protein ACYTJ0_12060 [Planctomycetota bacterium]
MPSRTLVAAALAITGWGTAAFAQDQIGSIREGQPFPALTLPSLEDGSPRSIADFRGRKVVLHVFASW